MFELVKQAIFTSAGLASLGREKLNELAAEVSSRAKLSEKEAQEFQVELEQRAEQARKDLQAEIDWRIDHALIQLGIVKSGAKKAAESARDELQGLIDQRIDAALQRLGIARTEDVHALTQRVELLERKLAQK
jgi:polyhydroxyalkanoate synthesis regulator phasin